MAYFPVELVSIDPGFNGTGAVYWSKRMPIWAQVVIPPRATKHYSEHSDLDIQRAAWIAARVLHTANYTPNRASVVVIELPEFQQGATRQMGWKTGDLQKLTMLVGVIAAMAHYRCEARVQLVTPGGWKGQLPKDVVQRRMTDRYGTEVVDRLGIKTHAWDALGIGAWAWQQPWMKKGE